MTLIPNLGELSRQMTIKTRSIWPVWVGRAMGKDTHPTSTGRMVAKVKPRLPLSTNFGNANSRHGALVHPSQ